jgi:hypothetical protein
MLDKMPASAKSQFVSVKLYCSSLPDEIQAEQDRCLAVTLFDPTFHSAQWTAFHLYPTSLPYLRGQKNLQLGFEGREDFIQLALEELLVKNMQQVGYVVTLLDCLSLLTVQLKKNIAGKERL